MQTTGWSGNEEPIRGLRAKTFSIDDAPDIPEEFIEEIYSYPDGQKCKVYHIDEWIGGSGVKPCED